ncbi:hypothetical protein OGAPHI_000852 [Ogataea philodendri]|uniref:Uncharacterized protein n=1 Tax=Ogataea philodendri TaxID=1378263 RepID=A0A9P8PFT6_9ASCO|nr:uncharacterized protein OGAPHI_000852 [Ogataea philodendri]KAH3671141.1 hypothetical protein OGAPHI_000852 [Ogataea philodendri]
MPVFGLNVLNLMTAFGGLVVDFDPDFECVYVIDTVVSSGLALSRSSDFWMNQSLCLISVMSKFSDRFYLEKKAPYVRVVM